MIGRSAGVLVAMLWGATGNCAAPPADDLASAPIDARDLSAFADGFITSRMTTFDIAGVIVSVVHKDRQIFARGYGIDHLHPLREASEHHSLFRLGSVSKTFTWTAVMQLVERGLIDIDAPVQDYLPNLQLRTRFKPPVTMKHLMAHTAGFEDTTLGHLFENQPSAVLPLEEHLARHHPEQVRPPGLVPAYSNFGAAVAGLVVANVSGMPFEDYVDQHLLQPLGMTRSTFREPWGEQRPDAMPPSLRRNLSEGYAFQENVFVAKPFAFIGGVGPAAALSATATDMARWMRVHLNVGRLDDTEILTPATAALMQSRHFALDESLNGIAHGFFESVVHGYRAIGHRGATLYFTADMRLIPELDLGIFIATNTAGGARLIHEFAQMVVARYFPLPPDADPEFLTIDQIGNLDDYAGSFLSTRRAYTTLERALHHPIATVTVTSDGQLLLRSSMTTTRMLPVGPDTFIGETPDDVFKFRRGPAGTVDALMLPWPSEIMEKASPIENPRFLWMVLSASSVILACVPVGAWLRRSRTPAQSSAEKWSARLAVATAIAWVSFYGLSSLGLGRLQGDPGAFFFDFPNPFIVSGLWAALAASLLTALLVVSVYPIWRDANWSAWRRFRHTGVAASAIVNVLILWEINALGFQY